MADDGGGHHEQAGQDAQYRHQHPLEKGQVLFFFDHPDKDGDIGRVQGDDGQLGGVKAEGPEPADGIQVRAEEVILKFSKDSALSAG